MNIVHKHIALHSKKEDKGKKERVMAGEGGLQRSVEGLCRMKKSGMSRRV